MFAYDSQADVINLSFTVDAVLLEEEKGLGEDEVVHMLRMNTVSQRLRWSVIDETLERMTRVFLARWNR